MYCERFLIGIFCDSTTSPQNTNPSRNAYSSSARILIISVFFVWMSAITESWPCWIKLAFPSGRSKSLTNALRKAGFQSLGLSIKSKSAIVSGFSLMRSLRLEASYLLSRSFRMMSPEEINATSSNDTKPFSNRYAGLAKYSSPCIEVSNSSRLSTTPTGFACSFESIHCAYFEFFGVTYAFSINPSPLRIATGRLFDPCLVSK